MLHSRDKTKQKCVLMLECSATRQETNSRLFIEQLNLIQLTSSEWPEALVCC